MRDDVTTQAHYCALDRARFETVDYLHRPPPAARTATSWCDGEYLDDARAFFDGAMRACTTEAWHATASGSMRRIFSDAPRALHQPPLATAWRALTQTLGIGGLQTPLPWWMEDAYGRDHHLGFTSPAGVAHVVDALHACDLLTHAVPLLEDSCGNPRYLQDMLAVIALLQRARAGGDWVVAVESGS